jgi:hypothetical protein
LSDTEADVMSVPGSSPTIKKGKVVPVLNYVGESNENRKTEIKIRNIAPLSYKLADMLPML